jgi:hypothetical protein
MKTLILFAAVTGAVLSGCQGRQAPGRTDQTSDAGIEIKSENAAPADDALKGTKFPVSVSSIIQPYLQMERALSGDDPEGAAKAGSELMKALKDFNKASLTEEQKEVYEKCANDAVVHAEHISASADDIKHQREHFEKLSALMIELSRSFNAGQVLYKIFCPMYNDGKGGYWLSESNTVKNPYYGSEMLTCGKVQEEIK